VFERNLPRHGFNFIRVVVFSIVPAVLDSHERHRAKARNDGIVGDKAVSAVRRLECDAEAAFCHDRVKVALNWTPYLADARVCAPFAPKVDLPNSVPQKPTHQTNCGRKTNTVSTFRFLEAKCSLQCSKKS
jgi:hypothetical protein